MDPYAIVLLLATGCVPTYFSENEAPRIPPDADDVGSPAAVTTEVEDISAGVPEALHGAWDVSREACDDADSATRLELSSTRWEDAAHRATIRDVQRGQGALTLEIVYADEAGAPRRGERIINVPSSADDHYITISGDDREEPLRLVPCANS